MIMLRNVKTGDIYVTNVGDFVSVVRVDDIGLVYTRHVFSDGRIDDRLSVWAIDGLEHCPDDVEPNGWSITAKINQTAMKAIMRLSTADIGLQLGNELARRVAEGRDYQRHPRLRMDQKDPDLELKAADDASAEKHYSYHLGLRTGGLMESPDWKVENISYVFASDLRSAKDAWAAEHGLKDEHWDDENQTYWGWKVVVINTTDPRVRRDDLPAY